MMDEGGEVGLRLEQVGARRLGRRGRALELGEWGEWAWNGSMGKGNGFGMAPWRWGARHACEELGNMFEMAALGIGLE